MTLLRSNNKPLVSALIQHFQPHREYQTKKNAALKAAFFYYHYNSAKLERNRNYYLDLLIYPRPVLYSPCFPYCQDPNLDNGSE